MDALSREDKNMCLKVWEHSRMHQAIRPKEIQQRFEAMEVWPVLPRPLCETVLLLRRRTGPGINISTLGGETNGAREGDARDSWEMKERWGRSGYMDEIAGEMMGRDDGQNASRWSNNIQMAI